ncbi:MAG TPA: hypothetical protein VFP34_14550 [Microlunatus sp.]|nr:hypothetical protein [Microlunatus sp.]
MTALVGSIGGLPMLALVTMDAAPQGGNGFAGTIVVAFVAVGLLVILAKWTSSKPKRPKK